MTEITAAITGVDDLVLKFRLDGEMTGTWVLDGEQIAGIDVDASTLQSSGSAEVGGTTAFTISGSVEDLITSAGGMPSQTSVLALSCSSTTLRLSHPLGEWAFTRDS
jgi:hypothetical protein